MMMSVCCLFQMVSGCSQVFHGLGPKFWPHDTEVLICVNLSHHKSNFVFLPMHSNKAPKAAMRCDTLFALQ